MGEPAIPTPAQRKATHELAIAIVESVRNDEPMPHPFDVIEVHGAGMMVHLVHVKEHMFQLAQELVTARAERAEALRELARRTGHANWPSVIESRVAAGVQSKRCDECLGEGYTFAISLFGDDERYDCDACDRQGFILVPIKEQK